MNQRNYNAFAVFFQGIGIPASSLLSIYQKICFYSSTQQQPKHQIKSDILAVQLDIILFRPIFRLFSPVAFLPAFISCYTFCLVLNLLCLLPSFLKHASAFAIFLALLSFAGLFFLLEFLIPPRNLFTNLI